MKIDYSLQRIRFEWDNQKTATNLRKHGIAFKNACEVFFDPLQEAIVGLTMNWNLLYVVYTMRKGDIFRIVSARSVTKHERKSYEEQ